MAYTTTAIEDALLAKIEPLKASLGVRTIKTYEEELDNEETIAKALALMPAILAVYGGSTYADHGERKIEALRWLLFCCDKSLRTYDEARRGGKRNPGAYAMLDGCRDALAASQLGLDVTPLKIVRQDAVWFGGGIAVYVAEYETSQALLYQVR